VDPIADEFAWVTPYNYAENYPTGAIDLHGLQKLVTTVYEVQRIIQSEDNYSFTINQLGPSSTTDGGDWSGYKQNNVFFFEGQKVSSLNDIDGYKEWKGAQTTEGVRTLGKITENTGDVLKISGLLLTPIAPELGAPLAKGGEILSLTGTGLQISADLREKKYEDAGKRLLVEALATGASGGIKKLIDNSGIDAAASVKSQGTEEILKSRTEIMVEGAKSMVKEKVLNEENE